MKGSIKNFLTTVINGAFRKQIVADFGAGNDLNCDFFSAPGDDSKPLPSDLLSATESEEEGILEATGYADQKNESKSNPGEKRIYGRNEAGEEVSQVYLQNDGSIFGSNDAGSFELDSAGGFMVENSNGYFGLLSNGMIVLNGTVIDQNGNILGAGQIRDLLGVGLGTHTHISSVPGNPSSPPTPGT